MKPHSVMLIAGAAALALSAGAAAASGDRHEITVWLPGGGTERIDYTGEAPQVVFGPSAFLWPWVAPGDFGASPSFADLERMSADMHRQMDALFKDELAVFSNLPTLDDTTLANLPPGTFSTTYFSTSFGNGLCTRVTQISKPAADGKPQIVSRESGNCGSNSAPAPSWDSPSGAHDRNIIETSLKTHKSNGKPTTL